MFTKIDSIATNTSKLMDQSRLFVSASLTVTLPLLLHLMSNKLSYFYTALMRNCGYHLALSNRRADHIRCMDPDWVYYAASQQRSVRICGYGESQSRIVSAAIFLHGSLYQAT